MIFDAAPRVENDPRRAERELFARVPYIQPGTLAPHLRVSRRGGRLLR